jgi:hypothetical protein
LSQKVKVIQESIDSRVQVDLPQKETEEAFHARMESLALENEARNLEKVRSRVSVIRQKELSKSKEIDLSTCSSKAEIIRQAFRYMLSVCDGAVQRDSVGFNKPDSLNAHWVLSSGLVENFELETAFLMLSRYKRQLEKTFPSLFENVCLC